MSESHDHPGSRHDDFLVVGLGGSAGAIPSLRDFLSSVPADSRMAFVVVLHLSPEHESHLAGILQGSTTIPVQQVTESVTIAPDHVYVIPPNRSLMTDGGRLMLSDVKGFEERRSPIDIFFRTLAVSYESRAVCVILSGSGADGSLGLRHIKEYNGLALVQEPAEAEFGEMPRNSIATDLVDFIGPAAELPRMITAYRDRLEAARSKQAPAPDEEQALIDIFTHLRMRTGHDFTNYKRATVMRRIERRLAVCDIAALPEYARFLRDHPEEAEALLRELLISVTNFFRDRVVFERLEQTVIPRLLHAKGAHDHIRVWVAGCASGEEAYSIAMLLADAAANSANVPDIQIFATDLDEDAIAKARNGFYTSAETVDVSPDRLRRYFVKEQDGYRVRRELRELVLFAHHNLIKDPPFSHLDLVSCRNVLIYLNRTAQERAMEVLHFALEPGGYLLLGTAESVDSAGTLFAPVDKETHIFQSRAVARTVSMPAPAQLTVAADLRNVQVPLVEPRTEPRASRFAPLELHTRLLEEYAPPSLIVDEQHAIVHLSERAGRYLQFPAGEASSNLLQVIRPELRIDLRTALIQAAQKRTTVAARGVAVHTGERTETVNMLVRPALRDGDPARGFFLVLFEEVRESVDLPIRKADEVEPAARQLEEELIRLKGQMRLTIEQYEVQAEEAKAANEELQAMNEELRSTAEELETSQEELQSVNEELQTVNQELKVKIDEISHANNDMRNLMSSTEIGTIFVDRALRVKLFTPRIRDIFHLIPADVGRPLADINSRLTVDELSSDLERVLERLQTIEREVETRDGHWHLMRLLPYRTAEDRIDGVVITFLDITERKHAEETVRLSREKLEERVAERTAELRDMTVMLRAIIDSSPLAIVTIDRGRRVAEWNRAAEATFGWPAEEIVGTELPEALGWPAAGDLDVLFGGHILPPRDLHCARRDGSAIDVNVFSAPLRGQDGRVNAVMAMIQDSTQRIALEREREHLLRRIVASQEEERQRIARELHDELGQHLTALKVGLEASGVSVDGLERIKHLVATIDGSIDRLTLELRPPVLDDVGLIGAIATLVDQFSAASGLKVDVHATGDSTERLPDSVETMLYRVLQEALTNVWKHANARSVSVIVEREPGQVQLIVEDDGQGFDPAALPPAGEGEHFGLLGIRERVSLIGGSFNVESTPRRGTTLYIRVPLSARS